MNSQTRIGLLKLTGFLMLALGILIGVAQFVDSGQTFREFREALKDGLFIFILGAFFLSQAGFAERIQQLEAENAALRAAKAKASDATLPL